MNIRWTAVVLIGFLLLGVESVGAQTIPRTDVSSPDTVAERSLPNGEAFRPGERIRLRVTYLGFTAGYLNVRVRERALNGRDVMSMSVKARSSGLAYWFYTIRDDFVSYVDPGTYLSLGYDYRQNHGGEKEFERVRYDHKAGLYFREDPDTQTKGTLPRYSMDVLSALFYLRSRDMTVGDTYEFPVHLSDETYRLEVVVEDREEIATSDFGWIEAFRIKPTLRDPEKERELRERLKNEKNRVRIWISADDRKLPLQIGIPAKVGTFWGYLSEYNPGHTSTSNS